MRIALISIDDLASAPPPPTLRFPVAKLVNLDSQGDGGDGFGPQRHAGAGRVSRAGASLAAGEPPPGAAALGLLRGRRLHRCPARVAATAGRGWRGRGDS